MKPGDVNMNVASAQLLLNRATGSKLPGTPNYGPATTDAVRVWQKSIGATVDGILEGISLAKLYRLPAVPLRPEALLALGVKAPNSAKFLAPLAAAMAEFKIVTVAQQAGFLANALHESADLATLVENLNYSAVGLAKTWPARYAAGPNTPNPLAKAMANNPQLIANATYSGRMGNGDSTTNDGWRYRGRGLFQITGKSSYIACGKALGVDLLGKPELLETDYYVAARSAAWYWECNGLSRFSDICDFDGVCDLINRGHKTKPDGDAIGYGDRSDNYFNLLKALAA